MSKKVFISSNQYPHNRQIQKFQLAQRKQNQAPYLYQQHPNNNHAKQSQSKIQKIIHDRIAEVQIQNKKLLDIANKLNSSSMMFDADERLPNIVYPIEEQMKSAFNELIESIQEFYIDIDSKIKQIGAYLTTISGFDTLETSKRDQEELLFSVNHQQRQVSLINQQQTFRSINQKIEALQKDLQQTKSNENKLMMIIQKLVQKYQLTNQTTMIKQDPFFKKKVQNLSQRIQGNQIRTQNYNPHNFREHNYLGANQIFQEANTFSRPNHYYTPDQNQTQQNTFVRSPLITSNAVRKVQQPQRNVHNNQHPNDYSICHQLNKIQENITLQNQRSFTSNNNVQPNHIFVKNKQKPKLMAQKMDASMLSVNSYAYSNSIEEQQEQQCFIKKLYSKQTPVLNKVSLKSCNNPNKTVFQLNRPLEQPIDQSNKNHRQAFLLTQLKRFN